MVKSKKEKKLTAQNKKIKKFKLKEQDKPNLYKEIFPYTEVSKIVFDNKIVPMRPAKEIFITDTTFRDGQQSRPPYTAEQIVTIFQFLSQLGGPNGVIRQSEFFLYSKKDKEAVEKCLELGLPYPEITELDQSGQRRCSAGQGIRIEGNRPSYFSFRLSYFPQAEQKKK